MFGFKINIKEYKIMIGKVTFSNVYSNAFKYRNCQPRRPQTSFTGIMDNPVSQKVKDTDGTTYIVEPNGTLIINKTSDEGKNKQNGTGGTVATGASGVVVGNQLSKLKPKAQESNNVETHEVVKKDDDITAEPQGADNENVDDEPVNVEEIDTENVSDDDSDSDSDIDDDDEDW